MRQFLGQGRAGRSGVKYHVVELDLKNDVPTGADIQNALATATGRARQPTICICSGTISGSLKLTSTLYLSLVLL